MAEAQSSILIVDDDAEDLASVERTLRSLGGEIVSIKDPHEVLPTVHRLRPDVVILDALLPGLSGFDLCKQIKTDPQLKATQVLILTGVYLRQQYRHEAIQQFKADAFLTKPFRPPELQRLVVQLLARKTRAPQSSFLKRIGLPASAEPKKRGFLERILGRSGSEEVTTVRIAPTPRVTSSAPPAEPVVEARAPDPAPAAPAKLEAQEAYPEAEAPAAEVASAPVPVEEPPPVPPPPSPEPLPEAVPEPGEASLPEAAPQPETVAVAAGSHEATEAKAEVPAEVRENIEAEPGPAEEVVSGAEGAESGQALPEAVGEEPPPPTLLEGHVPSEADEVTWTQADTRTREMTLEEAAARVAEGAASAASAEPPPAQESPEPTAAPAPPERPQAAASEEGLAAGEPPQAVRRPLFRVGEVPIYDEADFLTELKRELSKCKRVDRPLTLILIRVGDLGQIVELFGKDFRDPVLWHVAEQAMESLREVDLVGMISSKDLIAMTAFASDRYGGGRIVSRMRQSVVRKPFRVGEELPPIIPALDFGMATFPADGNEVSSLLRRAEEDLSDGTRAASVSD
jgi:diguanylate cyclase (GGDEF)-like protein